MALLQLKAQLTIWVVVLVILAAVIFVFGALAVRSSNDDHFAALMAPVTTALGALVGLLVPSPAQKKDA